MGSRIDHSASLRLLEYGIYLNHTPELKRSQMDSISHVAMLDDLTTLIRSNPDPRELKRAIAVQMWNKGHKHRDIQDSLSVSSGFISKWTQRYEREGILSLKLAHRGSTGYLDPEQRSKVIQWLQAKDAWHLPELQIYLEDDYKVVFKSKQSYYDLLSEAGLSWKKTQKRNPKTDREIVKKND